MTLWSGLLPSLLLVHVAANEGPKVGADANCLDTGALAGELQATETRLFSWRRMGGLDLPTTIQVLSVVTAAEPTTPTIGRIVLTRHRLFSSPETLLANGDEGRPR